MHRIRRAWNNLRTSFWFVPTIIVAASIVAALALIEEGSSDTEEWLRRWPRLFGAGAEGARGMLSTIAGSMITVVGVTFSMTLVTLALASSQYTSRVLRIFMGDRVMQVVLGSFTGIFTYCLIVLRSIRSGDEGGFVPTLAVAFGVILAIAGIGVLIYFIHHIAASIQASSIIASVAHETLAAVDRLFPEKLGENLEDDESDGKIPLPERPWQVVASTRSGYIQNVDNEMLLQLAGQNTTVLRMERSVGEFVVQGSPLASIASDGPPAEELVASLQAAYSFDRHRTLEQDASFGIRQLVDMALRALSPGINDTTTAVMCVDYLTAILSRVASRPIPSPRRCVSGELRVITLAPNFEGMVGEAFDQIRGSASGNLAVISRMSGALQTIGSFATSPLRRHILRQQALWLQEVAERTLPAPQEKKEASDRLARTLESLRHGEGIPRSV